MSKTLPDVPGIRQARFTQGAKVSISAGTVMLSGRDLHKHYDELIHRRSMVPRQRRFPAKDFRLSRSLKRRVASFVQGVTLNRSLQRMIKDR